MAASIGNEDIQSAERLDDRYDGGFHADAIRCVGRNDGCADLFGNRVEWLRAPPQ
jgi:hypothetical protein